MRRSSFVEWSENRQLPKLFSWISLLSNDNLILQKISRKVIRTSYFPITKLYQLGLFSTIYIINCCASDFSKQRPASRSFKKWALGIMVIINKELNRNLLWEISILYFDRFQLYCPATGGSVSFIWNDHDKRHLKWRWKINRNWSVPGGFDWSTASGTNFPTYLQKPLWDRLLPKL